MLLWIANLVDAVVVAVVAGVVAVVAVVAAVVVRCCCCCCIGAFAVDAVFGGLYSSYLPL